MEDEIERATGLPVSLLGAGRFEAQRLAQSGRAVERRPDDEASEKRVAGVYSWYRGDASSNSGYSKGEGSNFERICRIVLEDLSAESRIEAVDAGLPCRESKEPRYPDVRHDPD
jgi:hypothetical protein